MTKIEEYFKDVVR